MFTPTHSGKHQFSVLFKGKHFQGSPFDLEREIALDPNGKDPKITLSNSNATAQVNQGGHGSVLGAFGMNAGKHRWSVYLDSLVNSHWISLGVCQKPLPNTNNNFGSSYSWSSQNNQFPTSIGCVISGDWQSGDVIELNLDCDQRKLTIRNQRTGRSATMGVPTAELFPYFNLHTVGNKITVKDYSQP